MLKRREDLEGNFANDLQPVLLSEYKTLRIELETLKECQKNYFWGAVTVTGIILGVGSKLGNNTDTAMFYLAPLLIILPSWLIFFDKATTISRIVGYMRILEEMLRHPGLKSKYIYLGWENALRKCREEEDREKEDIKSIIERLKQWSKSAWEAKYILMRFESSHRYWIASCLTFFILAAFCLFLSISNPNSGKTIAFYFMWIFFVIIFSLVTIQNMYLIYNLIDPDGPQTYLNYEKRWKKILVEKRKVNQKLIRAV